MPISHTLENGDVVEILTNKHPRPALQWLEDLVTPSARSKLKNYFFSHNRTEFLSRGREMVNAELKSRGLPLLDNELSVLSTFDSVPLSPKRREDLLVKIGMGSTRTSSVLRHLGLASIPLKPQQKAKKPKIKEPRSKSKEKDPIGIEGEKLTMPYRFAKCCAPSPGSSKSGKLMGVVTRNGVIMVHSDVCKMAKGGNPERRLKMFWR